MKKLILVGAGHSHLQVIKELSEKGLGANIALVSDSDHFFYSGMMPGLLEGRWSADEISISLETLCRQCGIRFIHAPFKALEEKEILLATGERIPFDVCSFNIGSDIRSFPYDTSSEILVVKPFSEFIKVWTSKKVMWLQQSQLSIAVLGGGAAGIEVAASLQSFFKEGFQRQTQVHLYSADSHLLGDSGSHGKSLLQDLDTLGVQVHLGAKVTSIQNRKLMLEHGLETAAFDGIVICTGAVTPFSDHQISPSLLSAHGYLQVDETLRSPRRPEIFGAGDCIQFANHRLKKSGVHAVRQGRTLAHNLEVLLTASGRLKPYQPPERQLYILGVGPRQARALWGPWSVKGHGPWLLKQWIDKRYLKSFTQES